MKPLVYRHLLLIVLLFSQVSPVQTPNVVNDISLLNSKRVDGGNKSLYHSYTTQTSFRLRKPFDGNHPVNSWFDHQYPLLNNSKDDYIVVHTGDKLSDPRDGPNCTYGYNCYDGHDGIDFDMAAGTDVLAAESGIAYTFSTIGCNRPLYYIKIDHQNDYETLYVHLQSFNDIVSGQKVNKGDKIGLSGSSGCADGPHLHFGVKYKGTLVDPYGWQGTYSDPWQPTSICLWDDADCPPPPPPCPASDDSFNIILYKDTNFGCGLQGEGKGYFRISVINNPNILLGSPIQLPADFEASSISIPAGFRVTLKDATTGQALRCQNDNSFENDLLFRGFTSLGYPYFNYLNDKAKTITINIGGCTNDYPPNILPNAASLFSPANEANQASIINPSQTATKNKLSIAASVPAINFAPQLTWKNMGDNNGDEVRFFVEVIGDTRTVNSGWIDNTVWKPSMLDYQYGGYQWHVKARDGRGAESDWSETWSFSIQSPNKPPSITFNSANGDSFSGGVIYSRTSNWTFTGSASDSEGQLNRVEWRCGGDNCGAPAGQSGAGSWSYTQNGMAGRNDIYFMAYDGYGNNTPSRHLDLRIDQAAPTTTASLNGQSSVAQWPGWFTAAVKVNLHGADNSTGRAIVGMGKVHYQLDGGAWQVISASDAAFTVSNDGGHTVSYYSEDALGNIEAARSFTFNIDQTPPSLPSNIQETHSVVNGQWQKDQNVPIFTWNAATDAQPGSGLRGYQLYFGDDPNGVGYTNINAAAPRQWTPFPAGLPTGTSYLRIRTQDNALNWSAWATLFTFRYDGTSPENPVDVAHAAGINTAWQNSTSQANFSWQAAHDEGSGIQGYFIYWGNQINGTSTNFISANAYQNLSPLCAASATCIGYLRVRSRDNVGNLAESWNTVFILRYDNTPPLLDFLFNGGATTTTQTQVMLDMTATDPLTDLGQPGSGVYAARFSDDGQKWTEWEQPSSQKPWIIWGISRKSWPVYAQVKDLVGSLSLVALHEIYLDVNSAQPSSSSYRLFDYGINGGSGQYTSASYSGRGTLGPVADAPITTSAHYSLSNGYEAGSRAIPLLVPGHDSYKLLTGAFESGSLASPLQSSSYQLLLASGGIGLPATTTINSSSYQHQPGFLAGIQPSAPVSPPGAPAQPIAPAPDPKPTAACDAPSLTINDGAVYTDSPTVTVSLCAPYATEMMLGGQADFAGATWEPFAATRVWGLVNATSSVDPQFVYAQFKDASGKIYATYFDDILYDTNQPNGTLLLSDNISAPSSMMSTMNVSVPSFNSTVTLYVDGSDDNSGLAEMQISANPAFAGAEWKLFSPVAQITPDGGDGVKSYYARFRDAAGNLSGTTALSFTYDTQPPVGYIFADPAVLPGDTVSTTLHLGTYDPASEGDGASATVSDAVEMRLGTDPTLQNDYWQPLADTVTVAIDPSQPEGTFYVQYRDAAGNLSEITSTTWQLDTTAPALSAVAEPGTGNSRSVNIYASDALAGVANLYLSNDPLMQDAVTTLPYTNTLTWTFDERKVLWIVADDGVGNRSDPYPVYATDVITPPNEITPTPTVTETPAIIAEVTPTGTPAPPAIDSVSYSISYQGWAGKKDTKALSGGYRFASLAGQTISYKATTSSTSIALVTYKGPDQGKVQILVDGVSKGTFDLYNATPLYKNVITISGLTNKKHSITVKVLHQKSATSKGYMVRVDAVKIGDTVINDASLTVKYGGWAGAAQASAVNGSHRFSATTGANVTFGITSSQFTIITARGPAYGKVDIYVDNVLLGTYDLYNIAQEWQYKLVINGLTDAAHKIKIQVNGMHNPASTGNTVIFDAMIDP